MVTVFSWREAIQKSNLAPTTRHILLNLSTYMNDKGGCCFPSIELQAADTGLSKKAVIQHLQKAVDSGFLFKSQHGYAGQQWKRNEYRAIFPSEVTLYGRADAHADDKAEGGYRSSPPSQEGGYPEGEKVVTHGNTNSPENSPEIKINKKKPRKLVSLEEWEKEKQTPLCMQMMTGWVREKNFNPQLIREMIEEFRTRMFASDNRYADYKAAFQDWFNRGFLSKKPEQCKLLAQPHRRASISI